MRTRLACGSLLVLALGLVVPAGARAEGVANRSKKPSSPTRLRGASTVIPVPWGLVAMGGPKLRVMPTGKKTWETLHTVKGDNLYRVAADDAGRLLASWEQDPSVHLFGPGKKEHRTLAKPASPGKDFRTWNVDDIFFDEGGKDAILYMGGYTGGTSMTVVVFRYPLDGQTAPTELFRQTGHQLHGVGRLSLFVLPKDPKRSCDHNGCMLAKVVAWEITDAGARQLVLFEAGKREFDLARVVRGSDGERVAVVLDELKAGRQLLRWRRGDARPELRPIPRAPQYEAEAQWLTRSGDVVELWITDDRGLEVWRFPPKGERQVSTLPPQPKKTPDDRPLFAVYGFKERKNGDLVLHRGEYLYLLAADGTARRLPLAPLFKEGNEWAGAAIYVPEPESLWLGIEVGGGRDFVLLTFEEIEKRATPLP